MNSLAKTAPKEYRLSLHRYFLRRLRDPNDVNDLAQETYVRLLKISDDTMIDNPLAYLYGVAHHVLADYREEHEIDAHCDHVESDDDWSDKPSCVLPDDKAERLNLQQQIDRALAQLPPTHAAVLLCHKRDGLSYEETAEKLGLSIHTVEKYVTMSKAAIRGMSWER